MDIGDVINQYEVVEHIGRGGMADVWSARDRKLNRMVAIKTIAHGLSQDADPIGMFKQEAQTIAQMEHPHVLPIYDFGEYENQLYIVMRYVAGGSLEDLLRRGLMSVNDALRMGESIAQALDYAHANKIVHLDLKPPNVLLDSHQSPYLADFGLATVLDPEGKATNPGSGTLLYMAPEQMTSERIDYRADLYSFAIVMFHMLTGQLPFEGSSPLSLKQIQFGEVLPPLERINPALPHGLTPILRRATAVDPNERQANLMAVVDDLRRVYLEASGLVSIAIRNEPEAPPELYDDAPPVLAPIGAEGEILEAVDIYARARHNWAGGNGRFLLGVTNYMVMNGYYMDAELHGLELDESGMQMLLRGALEYDHEVDFWWERLSDDNRRWVCLHALRSGNAPARVRALYRLETLTDAPKPVIPKLVAQMLQVETNEDARIAALKVLGTRFKLLRPQAKFDVRTEFRGRLLTTLTRAGVDRSDPALWQEGVYSPEIDILIAEIALDTGTPRVSEYAARIIGRMHSITAVRHIANQQREGRKGALRALAFVLDEAPNLPDVVRAGAYYSAWGTNSFRRIFSNPLQLFLRFSLALIGAGLAMGIHIWTTFVSYDLFTPQRWMNSLAMGLLFGFMVAILVLVVGEFNRRLRGFWPFGLRAVLATVFGAWWGSFIWYQYTWGYLQNLPIDWDVMSFGGVGLMAGFVLTALFNLRSTVAIPLTALFVYIPVNIAHFVGYRYMDVLFFKYGEGSPFEFGQSLLAYGYLAQNDLAEVYWRHAEQIYTVAIPFALLIAFGGHFLDVFHDLRMGLAWLRKHYLLRVPVVNRAEAATTAHPSTPAPAAKLAHMVDPERVQTELDAARVYDEGRADGDSRTEPQPKAPVDTVRLADGPPTELDHNLGRSDRSAPETGEIVTEADVMRPVLKDKSADERQPNQPKTNSTKRVNISTGIRVDDVKKTPARDEDES